MFSTTSDAPTNLDVAHIPEEGSLKRLKAEDDDHVPFSPPITAPVPSSAASDYPSLVPSLEHSRPDFPIPPAHSTADQLIDSDIKVPSHLPSTHTPSVSSTPLEPLPTPSPAAPVPLTQEPRKPDDAEVSKVSSVCYCECFWKKLGRSRRCCLLWVRVRVNKSQIHVSFCCATSSSLSLFRLHCAEAGDCDFFFFSPEWTLI